MGADVKNGMISLDAPTVVPAILSDFKLAKGRPSDGLGSSAAGGIGNWLDSVKEVNAGSRARCSNAARSGHGASTIPRASLTLIIRNSCSATQPVPPRCGNGINFKKYSPQKIFLKNTFPYDVPDVAQFKSGKKLLTLENFFFLTT
jgi:hypothetical protein